MESLKPIYLIALVMALLAGAYPTASPQYDKNGPPLLCLSGIQGSTALSQDGKILVKTEAYSEFQPGNTREQIIAALGPPTSPAGPGEATWRIPTLRAWSPVSVKHLRIEFDERGVATELVLLEPSDLFTPS